MKGVTGWISGMSWWIRIPIAAVLLMLALKLTAWWLVEDVTDVAAETVDIEYDGSFYNWRGHFGTSDVVIRGYDENGEPGAEYAMDRLVVRPSSPLWLLRNMFASGGTRWVPDEIGLTFENFRSTGDTETTPGNYTNLPYDAKGCVPLLLTPREIMAMGLASPKRNLHIQLDRQSMRTVDATLTAESPGLGQVAVRATVEMDWPVRMKNLVEELAEAPLRSVTMTFDDLGFIAARNRACAAQHGLDATAFQVYHMREVRRRLGEEQVWFGDAALEQYAHFAANGGTLVVRTAGPRELTFGEFFVMDRMQKLQAFPLQIAAAGRSPSDMRVSRGVPPVAQPTVASAAAATAAPSDPTAVALPEPGSAVDYDAASVLAGEHIDVRTRYGSERKGTLLVHTPPMLTLKLDPADGGFTLTLNRQDVASIRYTPARAADGAAGSH